MIEDSVGIHRFDRIFPKQTLHPEVRPVRRTSPTHPQTSLHSTQSIHPSTHLTSPHLTAPHQISKSPNLHLSKDTTPTTPPPTLISSQALTPSIPIKHSSQPDDIPRHPPQTAATYDVERTFSRRTTVHQDRRGFRP